MAGVNGDRADCAHFDIKHDARLLKERGLRMLTYQTMRDVDAAPRHTTAKFFDPSTLNARLMPFVLVGRQNGEGAKYSQPTGVTMDHCDTK